jgi:hypothetical protein
MDIANIPSAPRPSAEMQVAAQHAESLPVRKSNAVDGQVQIPAVEQIDMRRVDAKRLGDIQQTIKRSGFTDTFAVSDKTFTIFKDSSGQYITRFTSLVDGSVTYLPEPEILKFSGGSESYYQVTA